MEQVITEDISILDNIRTQFLLKDMDVKRYSPLALAFIGDSVFDLVVKTVMVGRANCPANILHRRTSSIVRAQSQSRMAQWYLDNNVLNDEEADILRRGRNAKSATTAKNASVSDYRRATGVEALVGYLYLLGRTDRLVELIKLGIEAVGADL